MFVMTKPRPSAALKRLRGPDSLSSPSPGPDHLQVREINRAPGQGAHSNLASQRRLRSLLSSLSSIFGCRVRQPLWFSGSSPCTALPSGRGRNIGKCRGQLPRGRPVLMLVWCARQNGSQSVQRLSAGAFLFPLLRNKDFFHPCLQ